MVKTWATYLNSNLPCNRLNSTASPKRSKLGYTLLEMLVVLVLVGLVLALVMPSLQRLYSRYQNQIFIEETLYELVELRSKAQENGKGYWIPSESTVESILDQVSLMQAFNYESLNQINEVKITAKNTPIVIYPSGYCSGGTLIYSFSGTYEEFVLLPPYCNRQ